MSRDKSEEAELGAFWCAALLSSSLSRTTFALPYTPANLKMEVARSLGLSGPALTVPSDSLGTLPSLRDGEPDFRRHYRSRSRNIAGRRRLGGTRSGQVQITLGSSDMTACSLALDNPAQPSGPNLDCKLSEYDEQSYRYGLSRHAGNLSVKTSSGSCECSDSGRRGTALTILKSC